MVVIFFSRSFFSLFLSLLPISLIPVSFPASSQISIPHLKLLPPFPSGKPKTFRHRNQNSRIRLASSFLFFFSLSFHHTFDGQFPHETTETEETNSEIRVEGKEKKKVSPTETNKKSKTSHVLRHVLETQKLHRRERRHTQFYPCSAWVDIGHWIFEKREKERQRLIQHFWGISQSRQRRNSTVPCTSHILHTDKRAPYGSKFGFFHYQRDSLPIITIA